MSEVTATTAVQFGAERTGATVRAKVRALLIDQDDIAEMRLRDALKAGEASGKVKVLSMRRIGPQLFEVVWRVDRNPIFIPLLVGALVGVGGLFAFDTVVEEVADRTLGPSSGAGATGLALAVALGGLGVFALLRRG